MKQKMVKYGLFSIIICGMFITCKKMDSTYSKFVVPKGITYPGKVRSAIVYPGRNRVKISWLRSSDPDVKTARIFWNNFQDSVIVTIPATGDTIHVMIDNLQEKQYSFIVKTYDDKGNASVPVELFGQSYGDNYQLSLVPRPIKRGERDSTQALIIDWGVANKTGGAYATQVEYTDTLNQLKNVWVKVDTISSVFADYKLGTSFKYRTVYVPDSIGIDSFYTDYSTEYVAAKIPKAGLKVTTDSYAATSQLPNGGPPQFAFDDNINTFWHTHHTPAPVPGFPHWLAVDMKVPYNVTRVELTCRPNVTNTFTAFTMQGSMNGTTWVDYDSYTLIQKNPTQSFTITGKPQMRYIRIYATAGPNAYANLAEFTVFGY